MRSVSSVWMRAASFALISLTGACGSNTASDHNDNQVSPIIGGTAATSYPEAVLVDLGRGGTIVAACSGVLIAPRVVLTAGHCVAGYDGWAVTAPYANSQRASAVKSALYDYRSQGEILDPNAHDVGVLTLDNPIQLSNYPSLSSSEVPNNTQVVNIGRKLNGQLSNTDLFVSAPVPVMDGASQGLPNSYYSPVARVEQGDSGGPDMLVNSHTIVAVNSATAPDHEVLARVDLVYSFIKGQIDAAASGGDPGGNQPGTGGQCADTNQNCAAWAANGECQKNPAYMSTSCCASCKASGGGGGNQCVDTNQNCAYWASTGQCQQNPAYMLTSCCASCNAGGGSGGNQCVDTNQNCAAWAANGECQRNPAYMLTNCCASCKAGEG